jgi:hypothetical protein
VTPYSAVTQANGFPPGSYTTPSSPWPIPCAAIPTCQAPGAMLHVKLNGVDSAEATRFALSPTLTFRDAAASRPCG